MKTNQYDIYAKFLNPSSNWQKVARLVRVRGGWGIDYLIHQPGFNYPTRRVHVRALLYAVLLVVNTLIPDGWREFIIVRPDELEEDESSQG
jgi:hypothetical protein